MTLLYTIFHHIRNCINYLLNLLFGPSPSRPSSPLFQLSLFNNAKTLTFDNGIQVRIGKQIAEGGFSFVFEASVISDNGTSVGGNTSTHRGRVKYALKRINCSDHEILQSCRKEAGVHRSLPTHDNLMELLGLKFERDGGFDAANSSEYNVCYMLFPYIETSLRGEISERNLLLQNDDARPRRPFGLKEILNIFEGILEGISAMHSCNLSHRDLKMENVLLKRNKNYSDRSRIAAAGCTPVLMDFGSAGPLTAEISTRHSVLSAVETASQHTTISYRPPELFEGGMRHDASGREKLDYGKVDVWSLGCVCFGLMHGCSPFEMEFVRSNDPYRDEMDAVRIVECTQLKILGEVPYPPWASSGGGGSNAKQSNGGRYPLVMYDFVRFMVCHDRRKRPDVQQVRVRFGELYLGLVGERWNGGSNNAYRKEKRGDDFDSLIASRDFV